MISILVVISVLFFLIVAVSIIESRKQKIEVNKNEFDKANLNKCGCGKTNDIDGNCDGSHMSNN
jgi:CDGSH-type Zn-finger protein